jgi:hypothetical protein
MEHASLFNIHFLLDLSWDELRTAICPLRPLIGEDDGGLIELLVSASDPTFYRQLHPASTLRDIVCGSMHIMKKIVANELSWPVWQVPSVPTAQSYSHITRMSTWAWARLLKSCPPCPVLLQHLCELEIAAVIFLLEYWDQEDLDHVVKWLKVSLGCQ